MFKKADLVTYLSDWDRKGTVYFQHAVVYSCGKKQMVLTDAQTGVEMGRNYKPGTEQWGDALVLPRMSDDAARAMALELGATIVERERTNYERVISRSDNARYIAALRESIAELHEPRAISIDEAHEITRRKILR